MSFFFDCRFIRVDHHDGISRFSSELFSALASQTQVTAIVSDLAQLGKLPGSTRYLLVNDPKNPIRELLLPRKLNKAGASVVFSPMQTMGSIGKKYKLILTLHDLIYYKHRRPPRFLAWPIRLVWRIFHLSYAPVRLLLNRADSVVTISETTKKLMMQRSLTKRQVHLVHNASSMKRLESPLDTPKSRDLVYMGSFMPYKNVELLIKGLEDLPSHTLTLCSRIMPERKRQLLEGLSASTASRIRFLDGVSEIEYQSVLDESFALVSASKDEGFGIPLIEAMSRAIPIVVSNIEIFHEVSAGAGLHFDPDHSSSFAEAVRALESADSWEAASRRSLDRSLAFSWNQSANELLKVVRGLTA